MKIFGREPVVLLAAVAVFLKLGAAYGLDVSDMQQTLINTVLACIVAVASAIVLKTGAAYAAILQLSQAALALFVGFGLDMTATQQAGWMALVAAVCAVIERPAVTAPVAALRIEQSSPVRSDLTQAA